MTHGGEIEAEGETEAAGPGPGSHSPGRAPDSPWRMDAAVFSGAKKSEAELQGLRHRSSRFFRRKQAQGIVDYYSKVRRGRVGRQPHPIPPTRRVGGSVVG